MMTGVDDSAGRPSDEMPSGLRLVRTSPVFDEESVPAGLLGEHRVAAGVWGRLVVRSGALRFVFDGDGDGPPAQTVAAGASIVIPPERIHHLELLGPVTFVIEFHR